MSVWLCMASARTGGGTVPDWRKAGYKTSIFRNIGLPIDSDILIEDEYPGYAEAANRCAKAALRADPACHWVIVAGDDIYPDPNNLPEKIAAECTKHFSGTFGVMQPTGDRFAGGSIDRIAGSAWIGRQWCERAYGGNGPMWSQYYHMFADEELQKLAIKLGCFLQRRDLIHFHDHYMRATVDINSPAVYRTAPLHLKYCTTRDHWEESRALFESRQAAGFPGSDPLPTSDPCSTGSCA